MNTWQPDSIENKAKRLRFSRFLCVVGWTLGTVLLILPLMWLALLASFGDEDHAVYAVAASPLIGLTGCLITLYLLKRWSA